MRTAIVLSSIASLASVAVAQGYGRFPCTIVNGDGTFSPDQTQCDPPLVVPGSGTGTPGLDPQGDTPGPTSSVCTLDGTSGRYFCGIAGAACASDDNCDNGACTGGVCTGGPNQGCAGDDSNCSGLLYCLDADFGVTGEDVCGGLGSFCQDYTQGDPTAGTAANYPIFNSFCASGYCNAVGVCDVHTTVIGGSCADDPEFACTTTADGTALTCDTTTLTCVAAAVPSGAARQRRNVALYKKSLCPASHTACAIEGARGFECIDTQSNLEQCGACASAGGVDCTALPGVEAVGCVQGTCEIWSCADGFSWHSETSSCVASA
ncbi:hypothetical protein JCM10207_008016 [Rhodosporidiobolus poonsookiae]